jgi:hypothetical protein
MNADHSAERLARADARVREAPTRTAEGGTARLVVAIHHAPVPEPADTIGEGFADLPTQRSIFASSFASARVATRLDRPHAGRLWRGLIEFLRTPDDVAYVDGRRYFRASDGEWREPEAKPIALPDLGDPLWWLGALGAAAEDVAELGHEETHGTPTTRYGLTIDPAKVTGDERGLKQSTGRRFRTLLLHEGTTWLRRLPAQLWLDHHGRVRRLSIVPEDNARQPLWRIIELTDYGTPFQWEGPPTISPH